MREISPSVVKRINESSNIEDLREKLKLENDQDIFKLLIDYLDLITERYDNQYRDVSYKIIGFLEELATLELSNIINKCSMLTEQKYKIIDMLKSDDANLKDKEVVTLKELANKLENLEVSISFNINSLSLIENYNIVKHIIFKEKNRNLSKFLIDNNPYLINAFNKSNDNILIILTDHYLDAIDSFVKNNDSYNLAYCDELLEKILESDKIKKDENVLEICIEKVRNYKKEDKKSGSELNKAVFWYKHLEDQLDNYNYEEDLESLNNLYGVSPYFKKSIEEEGHRIGNSDEFLYGYDKNGEYIITIDNNLAFDRDDAISISKENGIYKLKIYVSDPNSFCDKDSLLMQEARKRVDTVYQDKESVGIFPRDVVAYYMSLEQNHNRYARVYEYTITENGIIIDFKITKDIVNVSRNYSYEEFNSALDSSDIAEEYIAIQNLLDLKAIIDKKYFKTDSKEEVTAESLLETFILYNNAKVAEFFSSKGIPFVYKHHSNTDNRLKGLLSNLCDRKDYRSLVKNAIKDGSETTYSTNKKSHEGLNFEFYCHSTSPLHSYADIVLNQCEDTFYFRNPSDKEAYEFEDYLDKEVEYINGKLAMLDRYREKYEEAKVRSRSK